MRRDSPLIATIGLPGLRVVVGGLLLVAGALKLRSPVELATEIANYQLMPAVAPYLAAVLPAIEVIVGLALAVGPRAWRRAAALAALALFALFEVAVCAAYLRGINIDCGCFGTGGGPITILTVLRNVLLIGASAVLLRWQDERHEDAKIRPAPTPR